MNAVALESEILVESRRSRSPLSSVSVWILLVPLIFYAVGSRFSFQVAADDTGSNSLSNLAYSSGAHAGLQAYLISGLAYAIVCCVILANRKPIWSVALQVPMLSLLPMLALASTIWSQSPGHSALNAFYYLIDTLFAYYLVVRFTSEEMMRIISLLCVVSLVLSMVMVVLFPGFGVMHSVRDAGSWQGIFQDRTYGARVLVFLLSPALVLARREMTIRRLFVIAFATVFISRMHAVTAIFILAGYVALQGSIVIARKLGRRVFSVVAMAVLPLIVGLIIFSNLYLPALLGAFGRNASLTGRTGIWIALGHSIAKQPLLGYGYSAFWLGLKGESANVILATHWVFGYAHNGLIEVVLQLGAVGAIAFLITFVQALLNGWYCLTHDESLGTTWYFGVVVLTLLYNIDEGTVMWPHELLSILYVTACCGLTLAAAKIRKKNALGGALRG